MIRLILKALAVSALVVACGDASKPGPSDNAGDDAGADAASPATSGDGATGPSSDPDGATTPSSDPDGATTGESDSGSPSSSPTGPRPPGSGTAPVSSASPGTSSTGTTGPAPTGDPISIDEDGNRVFAPGAMPLKDYIPCVASKDCFDGNGSCITQVTLNRAEVYGDSTRLTVPVSELPGFESVPAGHGVCSVSCTESQTACPSRFVLGARVDATPWTCQVVYVGASPYRNTDGLPLSPLPDAVELEAGVPFAALCRPPFERTTQFDPDFCVPCSAAKGENCTANSACVADAPFAASSDAEPVGHCLTACSDQAECPTGFACRENSASETLLTGDTGKFCFPETGSCGSCVDRDDDGRGNGACSGGTASTVDCDDAEPLTYYDPDAMDHAFPLSCGSDVDGNCNGLPDDSEEVGVADDDGVLIYGASHCGGCGLTCEGTFGTGAAAAPALCIPGGEPDGQADLCRPNCDDSERADCNGDAEDGCEVEVTDRGFLYVADCDGDGHAAAEATPHFDCGTGLADQCQIDCGSDADDTTCGMVLVLPTGDYGDDCNDDPAHGGSDAYPGASERCDLADATADNDCDGTPDNSELAMGAACTADAVGACGTNATISCDEEGAPFCAAADATQETCNDEDDDCDGTIDNGNALAGETIDGDPTVTGLACNISGATGACATGISACAEGIIVCDPTLSQTTDFPGDSVDSNCDGFDGDDGRAIFIASNGYINSGSGTRGRPAKTFTQAFATMAARKLAGDPITQIYVATGTSSYAVPRALDITGADVGFSIVGGYTFTPPPANTPSAPGTWSDEPLAAAARLVFDQNTTSPTATNHTSLCGEGVIPTACPSLIDPRGFKAAISVADPLEVLFKGITIHVNVPPAGFGNVVGLHCEANGTGILAARTCQNLRLDAVTVEMAGGAPGLPGAAPVDGADGGLPDLQLDASVTVPQSAGAFAQCTATYVSGVCATFTQSSYLVHVGSPFGSLGLWQMFDQTQGPWQSNLYGIRGGATSCGVNNDGGTGGGFYSYFISEPRWGSGDNSSGGGQPGYHVITPYGGGDNLAPSDGERGTLKGKVGTSAPIAETGGASGESLLAFDLASGTDGTSGKWGGGGGGSATRIVDSSMFSDVGSFIQPGAGGAAGGCGGGAGGAGKAGGSVIGVYYNDPSDPNISDTGNLVIQMLGSAGAGGAGSNGGDGGKGGTPVIDPLRAAAYQWLGGAGGGASGGGGGGGGAGGWSVAMAYYPSTRGFAPANVVVAAAGTGGAAGTAGAGGAGGAHGELVVPLPQPGAQGLPATPATLGAGLAEEFCVLDTPVAITPQPGEYYSCATTCSAGFHINLAGDGCDRDKSPCAALDGQNAALGDGYQYWSSTTSSYGACLGPCLGGFVANGVACTDVNVVCAAGAHWDVDSCVSD